jgi:hypothetical protein
LALGAWADDGVPVSPGNFPDADFRAWVSDNCDQDQDGVLSAAEIAEVTEMDVSGQSIADLRGVKFFTALETLDCSENTLTALELKDCASLREKSCPCNSLASLDVSGCSSLRFLDCCENELTSLDVRGLPSLAILDCSKNALTSLDVRGCASLETLLVEGEEDRPGALASLNAAGCSSLAILDCSGNSLTALEIGGCSSLAFLDCGGNSLTSLALGCFPSLTYLNCCGNGLAALNVSGCQELADCVLNGQRTVESDGVLYASDRGTLWTDPNVAVTASAAPGPVPAVAAVGGPGKIAVSWSSAEGAATYNLARQKKGTTSWSSVATGLTVRTFTDTGATPGVEYRYRVRAYNGSLSSDATDSAYASAT